MAGPKNSKDTSPLLLLNIAIVIAAIYFGRQVLIPLTLAILFAFLLTPVVTFVERRRLKRGPAVALVFLLTLSILTGIGWMVAKQLASVTHELPNYQNNIKTKIHALPNITHVFDNIAQKLSSAPTTKFTRSLTPNSETLSPPPSSSEPIPVEIIKPAPTLLRDLLGPFIGPLGTLAIVIVFTLLMLVRREKLRDRLLKLMGQGQIRRVTQALDEAAEGVSRYLQMQFIVNVVYGILIGVGLFCIGVPKALLWGALAGLFRFIPYVGVWIAASASVLFSLAVFNGWTHAVLSIGLFVLSELVVANMVEPWLYGAGTGLSAGAILLGAIFWTAMWGPLGLLLSTPITVCMVVIGRHVPQLEFLAVLLDDEPRLPLPMQLYQRLLARNHADAGDILKRHLKNNPLEDLYDSIIIPALSLAKTDRYRDAPHDERETFVWQSFSDFLDDFEKRSNVQEVFETTVKTVLCVPSSDEADEMIGRMLAQSLKPLGYQVIFSEIGSLDGEVMDKISEFGISQIFVSALSPFAVAQARSICKQLATLLPGINLSTCLWNFPGGRQEAKESLGSGFSQNVFTSLKQTVDHLKRQDTL